MISYQLQLDTANQTYPIYIGSQLISDQSLFEKHISSHHILVVTNETVAKLYLKPLEKTLTQSNIDYTILPDGEQYKTLSTWETILHKLVTSKYHRDSTLVTLGGGVVGDIGGFAAACYQRGINFIQVPTTLLSQVDSSIGGKTAVNHLGGKNLIGAFYQPNAVIIDTDTLQTLPSREFKAGLAEIIKAALIKDPTFFGWLESNSGSLSEESLLTQAIYKACKIKAEIVSQDEKENGLRALLNFGHTFAHAIEHALGYGTWLHGEAVAAGLVLAAKLSHYKGFISEADVNRIENLLNQLQLPTKLPAEIDFKTLFESMQMDKKIKSGNLRFILLEKIGHAIICDNVTEDELNKAIS